MKKLALIRRDNLQRLVDTYGWKPIDIARKTGRQKQQVNAWLKKGFGEEAAKTLAEGLNVDVSEFLRDHDMLSKKKDVNELLVEMIGQLNPEDKKTVARLIARLLNSPKVALIVTKEIHSLIDNR